LIGRNIQKAVSKKTRFRLPHLILVPIAAAAAILLIVFLNRNNKNIEMPFPYSPTQFVYESSEKFQTKVLAELIETKAGSQISEISVNLDDVAELSEILDELTESEQKDFYNDLKKRFGSFNGT